MQSFWKDLVYCLIGLYSCVKLVFCHLRYPRPKSDSLTEQKKRRIMCQRNATLEEEFSQNSTKIRYCTRYIRYQVLSHGPGTNSKQDQIHS